MKQERNKMEKQAVFLKNQNHENICLYMLLLVLGISKED